MSLWEYKHITSGPHGFASPALLESYLNQLGKDEWEVISYQTLPSNALAFNGVARRTTVRDWTLADAAAAAAKIEAEKLRAEFAAKFQGNDSTASTEAASEKPSTMISETAATEDGYRKLRDTERDSDPDAPEGDEWDNYDDDLPIFFEAIKPHLRKNQRGNGQSVGVTFLAKRWEQTEGDLIGALKECGFSIPETEDASPDYIEFEGDLYWLNLNNRHELFINTREKPRPVFRVVPGKKLDPSDPTYTLLAEEAAAEQADKAKRETERLAREAEQAARRAEHEARRLAQQAEHEARRAAAQAAREAAQATQAAARAAALAKQNTPAPASLAPSVEGSPTPRVEMPHASTSETSTDGVPTDAARSTQQADGPAAALPQGEELLASIRPQMRRNRRGQGYSGSTVYLARALKHPEAELVAALAALGLQIPDDTNAKPVPTILGEYVYWLNKDPRGTLWINGDEAPAAKPESTADDHTPGATHEPTETTAAPTPPDVVTETQPATPIEAEVPPAPTSAEIAPLQAASGSALAALRLLLKPNKRGSGVSAETSYLARTVGQDLQVLLTTLSELGFALPATKEHKPSFVAQADEIYWLNKNPKDGSVWLNAKASKSTTKKTGGTAKPRAKKPSNKE